VQGGVTSAILSAVVAEDLPGPGTLGLLHDEPRNTLTSPARRPRSVSPFEVRHRDDSLTGERALAARALVGVPWPPAWPWQGSEASVPFLRLELEHERTTTATTLRSSTGRASLAVSLNREIDLVVRFVRTEPTALDVVRGIGVRRTFAVACVYARGR
jgi:hypothetical protein